MKTTLETALILAFCCATLAQAAPCEAPFVLSYLKVGTFQRDVIAADFDGDGIADLAVVTAPMDSHDDELLLFRGRGDGTFAQPEERKTIARGGAGKAVAADFNRDGALDIAVADYESGQVAVAINDGKGRFSVGFLRTDLGPVGITASDFDGDGVADLAVTATIQHTLNVYLNRGSGVFVARPQIFLGSSFQAINLASGDLDGDGKADLVIGSGSGPIIHLRRGAGDGSFAEPQFGVAGQAPVSVALVDVDHDGDLDILTANEASSSMSVLINNGHGAFSERASYPAVPFRAADAHTVLAFGFTATGNGQALVMSSYPPQVTFFTSNGDGTFHAARTFTIDRTPDREASVVPGEIAGADFDGDGDLDFAVTSLFSRYLTLATDPCKPPVRRRAIAPH